MIFVHGGAWGSGNKWEYRLIAKGIGEVINAKAIVILGVIISNNYENCYYNILKLL